MRTNIYIKGAATIMATAVLLLAGCQKDDSQTKIAPDWDNLTFVVNATHADNSNVQTRALKDGWKTGDKILAFFNDDMTKYVLLTYDNAGEWTGDRSSVAGIATSGSLQALHVGSSTFGFDGTNITGIGGDLLFAEGTDDAYTIHTATSTVAMTLSMQRGLTTAIKMRGGPDKTTNEKWCLAGDGVQVQKTTATSLTTGDLGAGISFATALATLFETSDAEAGTAATPDPVFTTDTEAVFHVITGDVSDPVFKIYNTDAPTDVYTRTFTGRTVAAGQTVSFDGPASPDWKLPAVTIGTHPVPTLTVVEGKITENLSVTASVALTAGLTYQWFIVSTTNGEQAIPGATAATLALPNNLVPGTYSIFCVVSATGATDAVSDPCDVTVIPALAISGSVTIPAMTVGIAIPAIDLNDYVSGGTAPYTFALSGGNALPLGVTLNETTGVIGGNPTAVTATGTATVSVTDTSTPTPQTATINVNFGQVNGPLSEKFSVPNTNGTGDIFYKRVGSGANTDVEVTNHLYSNSIYATYSDFTGGDVVIPATVVYQGNTYNVVRVGYSAFRNCAITSATLPEGIDRIGGAAFFGCEQLTKVNIPMAVTYIDRNAFAKCPKLTDVSVYWNDPSVCGFETGDYGTFGNTTVKAAITLYVPAGKVATYRAHSIWGTLGNIVEHGTVVPAIEASGNSAPTSWALNTEGTLIIAGTGTMTRTGWSTHNAKVKSIVINEGVTTIGNQAIYYCENLEQLHIPASVMNIVNEISYGSFRNPMVTVAAGNTAFFADASGALYNKTAGDTYNLFSIPSLLSGEYTILDGTTTMATGAVSGLTKLTKLTIPASMTSFGTYNFQECGSLTDLVVNWTNLTTAPQPTNLTEADITLHVPAAVIGDYNAHSYWNTFKARVAQPVP